MQVLFNLPQAAGVHVGLGRHAEHRFERALQVEGTAAEFFGQQAERQLIFDVLLDVAANRPHQRGLRISVHRLRTAAQAGAIAGLLGCEGMIEKAHILAARAFGGTRRTAEYAGARNGENERAVEGAVAIDDGLPAAGVCLNCLCTAVGCGVRFIGSSSESIALVAMQVT